MISREQRSKFESLATTYPVGNDVDEGCSIREQLAFPATEAMVNVWSAWNHALETKATTEVRHGVWLCVRGGAVYGICRLEGGVRRVPAKGRQRRETACPPKGGGGGGGGGITVIIVPLQRPCHELRGHVPASCGPEHGRAVARGRVTDLSGSEEGLRISAKQQSKRPAGQAGTFSPRRRVPQTRARMWPPDVDGAQAYETQSRVNAPARCSATPTRPSSQQERVLGAASVVVPLISCCLANSRAQGTDLRSPTANPTAAGSWSPGKHTCPGSCTRAGCLPPERGP